MIAYRLNAELALGHAGPLEEGLSALDELGSRGGRAHAGRINGARIPHWQEETYPDAFGACGGIIPPMGDQLTKLQENLQRNLRRRLEAAGLSDRGLSLKAKRNGQRPLSDTTVKSIMNGTIPKVDTLKALADELGCTVNDLIADDEDLGANERPDYMGEKLSLEEQVLISRYRALPQHERQVLSLMFDAFMLRHSAAVTQPTPIDAQKGRR
jgi:transcriptional regulator with XRE-family HTH domain